VRYFIRYFKSSSGFHSQFGKVVLLYKKWGKQRYVFNLLLEVTLDYEASQPVFICAVSLKDGKINRIVICYTSVYIL